ncbi:MAG: hypothetical protein DKM50_01800 [Candidatus Margulisiibacteriota bacterium]|nr:MAG: hypothetical protein A2X43_13345 [Candidatus Margulisbacteria bacterium GWD2_39_127]OGI04758.1 MAG: hypothetical protein A2X42_10650 [Candidatus Margulisbacteria bacterium GWF2_38_17]OGI05703.1 MAG: hypothetical protein A2X41_03235 [Candidatus Margulisbacteria bacterium GWE2_39_32]PZM83637.1 MAG: hypothetical protein DKM50_01800 [Candidatus Margulisiibacteriota bacterium]HAR62055.1 hypothetical protein [Candidatus Margulisiibacteriota bacterium]
MNENYFYFITKKNIQKFVFLLDKELAKNPGRDLELLTIVIGCLPGELAVDVLEHYPMEMQAEIMVGLVNYQQFEAEEVKRVVELFSENIKCVLGGEEFTKKVFERLDNDEKIAITSSISKSYSECSQKISHLVILFDDLFDMEAKDFNMVFSGIDANILAPAMVNMPDDKKKKVLASVSEGMGMMINEFIELRGDSIGKHEIEQAQKYIIDYSATFEAKGLIRIK